MSVDIGAKYCITFEKSALAAKLGELTGVVHEHDPDGVPNDVFNEFFGLLRSMTFRFAGTSNGCDLKEIIVKMDFSDEFKRLADSFRTGKNSSMQ